MSGAPLFCELTGLWKVYLYMYNDCAKSHNSYRKAYATSTGYPISADSFGVNHVEQAGHATLRIYLCARTRINSPVSAARNVVFLTFQLVYGPFATSISMATRRGRRRLQESFKYLVLDDNVGVNIHHRDSIIDDTGVDFQRCVDGRA